MDNTKAPKFILEQTDYSKQYVLFFNIFFVWFYPSKLGHITNILTPPQIFY